MKKTALYKQIQMEIKGRIASGQLRPLDRIPSEQELMDEFKVSKITVKNALTELADEGLVTRIQGKGTFVAADLKPVEVKAPAPGPESEPFKVPLIGFIIPTMKTTVIQKLVDHIEFYLKEAGFRMILSITREHAAEESRAITALVDAGVQGLIVFPTEDEKYNESLLRLSLDKFPFVFIDRFLRNIETYTITSDNDGGAYRTVTHLLSKGHRQIALISPENTNTAIEDRTTGFEKAYIDQGESIDKSLWCHVPLEVLRSEGALNYVTDFLKSHPTITAAFTLTEEIAGLTWQALRLLERRTEVELFSFDNPDIPNVPYVQQDEQELARSAVMLLQDQIGQTYDPRHIVVPVQLVFP
ncbi:MULTISPECIES: GntR family transcriptional regulator [unclassified Paenibacillus]|uniref:GntR family transcriptional regulator n=1 Tax=unclassified Paenibacillus TaxID=185978 RepID=UPI00104B9E29|nr:MULTISPECIES: GntR family transcriptional regulator [unclassified Paenibacillus]NIK69482.1 DNA-binding LacI/PurR family transcriptional regulator [Paenibacillus sp. BK720]TCM95660.1 DNA-binding LacI/PurR family transcriptional regulator [Paenibacillus sp. BK033]